MRCPKRLLASVAADNDGDRCLVDRQQALRFTAARFLAAINAACLECCGASVGVNIRGCTMLDVGELAEFAATIHELRSRLDALNSHEVFPSVSTSELNQNRNSAVASPATRTIAGSGNQPVTDQSVWSSKMKYLLIRTTLIVMAVCVSVLLGVSTAAWAQDSIEQGAAKMQSAAKIRSEVQLKTLDDLRRLGTSDIFKSLAVVQSAEISGGGKPVSGQVTIEKVI